MRCRNGVAAKLPRARGVPLKYIFVETTHRNKDKHHHAQEVYTRKKAENGNIRRFQYISGLLRRLHIEDETKQGM